MMMMIDDDIRTIRAPNPVYPSRGRVAIALSGTPQRLEGGSGW